MRRYATLTVIFLFCATYSGYAQNLTWVKEIGLTDPQVTFVSYIDDNNNIYLAGHLPNDTVDFDPGPGIHNLYSVKWSDFYLLKLDAAGNFLWVKTFRSTDIVHRDNCRPNNILIDSAQNVYLTGWFTGEVDFDPGTGVQKLATTPLKGFVVKLDAEGDFVWVKTPQSSHLNQITTATMDTADNLILAGVFYDSCDVDFGPGVHKLHSPGITGLQGFIVKMDKSGDILWAQQLVAGSTQFGYVTYDEIIVDNLNNILARGSFKSDADFDPGPGTHIKTTNGSNAVGFVQRLRPTGKFSWVHTGGINDQYRIHSIAVDREGNVYTTGDFQNTVDFDHTSGTKPLTATYVDMFIGCYDSIGTIQWVHQFSFGSPWGYLNPQHLVTDNYGHVYFSGALSNQIDFDPGPGSHILKAKGIREPAVMTLDKDGSFVNAFKIEGNIFLDNWGLFIDLPGNIYMTGIYLDTADFDPGPGIAKRYTDTPTDVHAYILKLSNPLSAADIKLKEENAIIYPNPVRDVLRLSYNGVLHNITVRDINGRIISNHSQNGEEIDVSGLLPGIYLLHIETDKGTGSYKFLKQ